MAFPNAYTHRKVAFTSARGCDICCKPSTSVLTTAENKDFFYVCPSHLKDRGFCTPRINMAAEEARRRRLMDPNVARFKAEYETRQEREKEDKEKDKDGEMGQDDGHYEQKRAEQAEKKLENNDEPSESPAAEEESRVFELKAPFYQQRLVKKRQVEMAKRNRERIQDPTFFPPVPKGMP